MHAQGKTHQALALFDFDGTLCKRDSFTGFMFFAHSKMHVIRRGVFVLPWILTYYLKRYPAHLMRPKLYRALFKNCDAEQMHRIAQQYADQLLHHFDLEVYKQLRQHQQRGDRVILVSASLDLYLAPLCQALNIELLCTQVEVQNQRLSGAYSSADCSNAEKVKRIHAYCDLAQYHTIYAYGNSPEDQAMLNLADYAYLHGQTNGLPTL